MQVDQTDIPTIIIASRRISGDPGVDLQIAAYSAQFYSKCNVLVAVGGDSPQKTGHYVKVVYIRQPESCKTYGEAFDWAVKQSGAEHLIVMNDDAVLQPDTVSVLLEDKKLLEEDGIQLGFLACRSNFVPGPQNIRCANGGALAPNQMRFDTEDQIIPAKRVSPICAYISRKALDDIGGFPPINWYSDDLMCHDLSLLGYEHFVSRAYVHHIGQRATTQGGKTTQDLYNEGRAWVKKNRPDFWENIK